MKTENIVVKAINVSIVEHRTTHLLIAMSDDLPGLMIAARSEEQIYRELPEAIREVLEAQGKIVLTVEALPAQKLPKAFMKHSIIASARLEGS